MWAEGRKRRKGCGCGCACAWGAAGVSAWCGVLPRLSCWVYGSVMAGGWMGAAAGDGGLISSKSFAHWIRKASSSAGSGEEEGEERGE